MLFPSHDPRWQSKQKDSKSNAIASQVESPSTSTASASSTSKKKKEDPHSVLIPQSLKTTQFEAIWPEFIDHRAEIKEPMTERAAKMMLSKLSEFGPDLAVKAITESISQGWKGVFPDKHVNNGKPKNEPTINTYPSTEPKHEDFDHELRYWLNHNKFNLRDLSDEDRREKITKAHDHWHAVKLTDARMDFMLSIVFFDEEK